MPDRARRTPTGRLRAAIGLAAVAMGPVLILIGLSLNRALPDAFWVAVGAAMTWGGRVVFHEYPDTGERR